jgi:hypothetical protein
LLHGEATRRAGSLIEERLDVYHPRAVFIDKVQCSENRARARRPNTSPQDLRQKPQIVTEFYRENGIPRIDRIR